jgi:hypothetical protein
MPKLKLKVPMIFELRKRLVTITGLFLLSSLLFSQYSTKTVDIDHDNYRNLNLSEIADNITTVTLSTPSEYPLYNIQDLIITDIYFFVFASCDERKTPNQVFQYRNDGSFVRRIGLKNEKTGKIFDATDLYFDNNKLYVQHLGSMREFDLEGNCISIFTLDNFDNYVYNGYLWSNYTEADFDKGITSYFLTRKRLGTDKMEEVSLKYQVPMMDETMRQSRVYIGGKTSYSIVNGALYVISSENNTVYRTDPKYNINSLLTFNVKKEKRANTVSSFVFGNYVQYAYIYEGVQYVYIYTLATDTGVNIKLGRDSRGDLVSGLIDDIMDNGFIRIRSTNISDKVFFTLSEDFEDKTRVKDPDKMSIYIVDIR